MRKVYTWLAWLIAAMVLVQAAAIALGFGGMMHFVSQGGVVDKALTESRTGGNFTGELGFPIHALVGGLIMPVAALVLVVLSWFTKVRGATWWAVGLFVLIFVQGSLGYTIKDVPFIGALHGANALAVFVVAVVCARRAQSAPARPAAEPATADAAA